MQKSNPWLQNKKQNVSIAFQLNEDNNILFTLNPSASIK